MRTMFYDVTGKILFVLACLTSIVLLGIIAIMLFTEASRAFTPIWAWFGPTAIFFCAWWLLSKKVKLLKEKQE